MRLENSIRSSWDPVGDVFSWTLASGTWSLDSGECLDSIHNLIPSHPHVRLRTYVLWWSGYVVWASENLVQVSLDPESSGFSWYPLWNSKTCVSPIFVGTSSCHIKLAISPFYPHICCLNLYLKMSNRLTDPYGGSWNEATPKSSFLFSDFPWNKPSSYWGTPIYGNHHIHWHMTSMTTLVSGPRLWAATLEAFAWLLVNPLEGQEEFKEWSMGPSLSLSPKKKYTRIPSGQLTQLWKLIVFHGLINDLNGNFQKQTVTRGYPNSWLFWENDEHLPWNLGVSSDKAASRGPRPRYGDWDIPKKTWIRGVQKQTAVMFAPTTIWTYWYSPCFMVPFGFRNHTILDETCFRSWWNDHLWMDPPTGMVRPRCNMGLPPMIFLSMDWFKGKS